MSKAWKSFEARVAKRFGLKRRGADYGDRDGGKTDAVNIDGTESDRWALECKLHGRPAYQLMLDACRQVEAAAKANQEPIVVVGRSGRGYRDADALVIQRLEVFEQWRLGGSGE